MLAMMMPSEPLLISAIALFLYMSVVGWICICKKRVDGADTAWGGGFLLVSWVSFLLSPFSWYGLGVNLLVTIWAFRIGFHIYLRNRERAEDFRYVELKKKGGGKSNLRLFFEVFLLQGVILYIVALPILWIHTHSVRGSAGLFQLGFLFWLVGFLLETISDAQLAHFKKNPLHEGKILETGLWSYSRHPNYLGEIIQWWAIWFLALPIPGAWLLFISPLLLTFLIIKVSGIPPLEERMAKNSAFAAYAKKTPSLVSVPFLNGVIYFLSWLGLVFWGAQGDYFLPILVFIGGVSAQVYLFKKSDAKSLATCLPLALSALLIGSIQEILYIHFSALHYRVGGVFPPFWVLLLYPVFSLTLNSSLSYLNRNLIVSFFVGGVGALFSYLSGERLGAVALFYPFSYISIIFSWGLFLTLLLLLNRELIRLKERYNYEGKEITVFYDENCPICRREIHLLKKRKATGEVKTVGLKSADQLKKITEAFSFEEAMKKIHVMEKGGAVLQGTEALSALYASTNLIWLAILLQAPGFRWLFHGAYALWARFRPLLQE